MGMIPTPYRSPGMAKPSHLAILAEDPVLRGIGYTRQKIGPDFVNQVNIIGVHNRAPPILRLIKRIPRNPSERICNPVSFVASILRIAKAEDVVTCCFRDKTIALLTCSQVGHPLCKLILKVLLMRTQLRFIRADPKQRPHVNDQFNRLEGLTEIPIRA